MGRALLFLTLLPALAVAADPPQRCEHLLRVLGLGGFQTVRWQGGRFLLVERISPASLVGRKVEIDIPIKASGGGMSQGWPWRLATGEVVAARYGIVHRLFGLNISVRGSDGAITRTVVSGAARLRVATGDSRFQNVELGWTGLYVANPLSPELLVGRRVYVPSSTGVSLAPEASPKPARYGTVASVVPHLTVTGDNGQTVYDIPSEFQVAFPN